MSVTKFKKISKKAAKNLVVKEDTLYTFIENNLVPKADGPDAFVINTVESTRLGVVFGRNIFGKRLNAKFVDTFTKLTPAFNIGLKDGKMTFDVYSMEDQDLLTGMITPLFDDVEGLTIEIIQHFEDSDEVGTMVGE